jgi:hypothetical protein
MEKQDHWRKPMGHLVETVPSQPEHKFEKIQILLKSQKIEPV